MASGKLFQKTKLLFYALGFTLIAACTGNPVYGQPEAVQEYELKAAVLYKIVKYVDWPAASFKNTDNKYILYILGEDPFGEMIQAYENRSINDKKLEIRRARRVSDIGPCHILFIGSSEEKNLSSILKAIEHLNILTVADMEEFAHRGGIINFVLKQNRITFEINLQSAKDAELQINAKLLRLATIVDRKK